MQALVLSLIRDFYAAGKSGAEVWAGTFVERLINFFLQFQSKEVNLVEFKLEKLEKPNQQKYPDRDIDVAREFTRRLFKEFGSFVKAVVLFGSAARFEEKKGGDIDILVIVDDLTIVLKGEFVEAYRIIIHKIVADVSKRLHITTLRFTSFWEYARNGDPVAINMLRDGVALIDTGFFEPLQVLLKRGRIRPTMESVWTYFVRAPATLVNSKWHVIQGTLDLYWACIDAAHAAIMRTGEIPPTPAHVADMLDQKLVKTGKLDKKYAATMQNFYNLAKMIMHREIKEVSGDEYERYYREAKDFVEAMKNVNEGKIR